MQGKSLLALAFGLGRIPDKLASQLAAERIVISDDGVPMSLHFQKYRSPRNGFTGRKGLAGYVVLTANRLVAKGYWETTELPLKQLSRENISYGVRSDNIFWFAVDAGDFYEDRSGRIEHRFTTPYANAFKHALDQALGIESSRGEDAVYAEKNALFYSRRDTWATLLVWGIVAAAAITVFAVKEAGVSATVQMLTFLSAMLVGGTSIYFWGTTYYYLTPTHLNLRSGLFHSSIPLDTIVSVEPRRWAAGLSYAWSLDTLRVESTQSRFAYLVAPDDPAAFLEALQTRCPHLPTVAGTR